MTDRSHFPASIRARVHDGAIDRVTRFFNATLADAFIEILQNSRRSGATRLDVVTEAVPEAEASGRTRVTVTDDGGGISYPALMLCHDAPPRFIRIAAGRRSILIPLTEANHVGHPIRRRGRARRPAAHRPSHGPAAR